MLRARVALFLLFVLTAQARALIHHDNRINLEFHADNVFLTERVNNNKEPYSAAVDTAQMLFDELGYTSPILHVPLLRSFHYMDNGGNICVLNKIKAPEREQKYLYSLPLNYFQTQRLYQLASLPPIDQKLLTDAGEVLSIHEVLDAYPRSHIVLPKAFSYGEKVDADLQQVNHEQIVRIENSTYYTRFMALLAAKKTDFALIFPLSVYKTFGDNIPVEVRSYPIADNPSFVSGHVICANTPLGEVNIKRVNQAIKQVYRKPAYIDAHTRYLPVQDRANIRAVIESAIEKYLKEK